MVVIAKKVGQRLLEPLTLRPQCASAQPEAHGAHVCRCSRPQRSPQWPQAFAQATRGLLCKTQLNYLLTGSSQEILVPGGMNRMLGAPLLSNGSGGNSRRLARAWPHAHVKSPTVFAHSALAPQSSVPASHSSISGGQKTRAGGFGARNLCPPPWGPWVAGRPPKAFEEALRRPRQQRRPCSMRKALGAICGTGRKARPWGPRAGTTFADALVAVRLVPGGAHGARGVRGGSHRIPTAIWGEERQ